MKHALAWLDTFVQQVLGTWVLDNVIIHDIFIVDGVGILLNMCFFGDYSFMDSTNALNLGAYYLGEKD